ncbi:coniferyl aldehyde dehydrogenase [Vibrio crassostreae]|uniref:coniferyl aldehyde dehydrogenase n=1 Tax=Vibrio crassostreae TaxID=246167 RepID=UPI00104B9EDC|nr:coniferyl aldehyde dehydrogenase [Vibrio crassostreae]TCO01790.1 coniferyl-aldehyde dehydrogenase [Vibrio crassostreae]CAK2035043.1 putative coniferyl aldehyde dehydrogenase [Vibrio crassostreae]CAK2071873.1 putative coniferyl aldehyde dehydrogenase [Vibrio crassostreae]CAK2077379.1 putative coniferyl aldehyde dehydrogenase [Vibrio crassostreae]CAK2856952.1 putative coniferyl aldehyde dehydrogenase [Vibrio crassostreae]
MNSITSLNEMKHHYKNMKDAYNSDPMPSLDARVTKLNMLRKALIDFSDRICDAMNQDYGQRSVQDTLIADVLPCVANIDYSIEHISEWMAPSVRSAGALLSLSQVEVVYQPKGVVGIVTPWNFPVMLSVGPLISAITAGNRAMIKMSEFTPNTNQVLSEMLSTLFNHDEVVVVEGEAGLSAEFTALPFDHLLFTGSTAVGRLVMKAASANLTPLTLELGGKSPVIVADDVSMELAVERIVYGKSLNNGQVCVAPDYVMVPEGKKEAFILEYKRQYQALFPKGIHSENLTSVANSRQYDRVISLLNTEIGKGTRVEPCHVDSIDENEHRLVTHLVVEPSLESNIMDEEIFGPLLPIVGYKQIDEAIELINSKPRPLAMYLMTFDEALQKRIKHTIHSGGMCINDCVFHLAVDDAPFGGIGESGKGNYHGKEGFITFSHAKTVMTSGHDHQIKHLFSAEDNEFKSAVLAMLGK